MSSSSAPATWPSFMAACKALIVLQRTASLRRSSTARRRSMSTAFLASSTSSPSNPAVFASWKALSSCCCMSALVKILDLQPLASPTASHNFLRALFLRSSATRAVAARCTRSSSTSHSRACWIAARKSPCDVGVAMLRSRTSSAAAFNSCCSRMSKTCAYWLSSKPADLHAFKASFRASCLFARGKGLCHLATASSSLASAMALRSRVAASFLLVTRHSMASKAFSASSISSSRRPACLPAAIARRSSAGFCVLTAFSSMVFALDFVC
mmetsp:Transcript_111533/g.314940  ORF Transcript_111533/g.314940 Transcript_111533/m.314940 type:complete len:269 (+) Transcript_111533:244-1050(+)